MVQLCGVSPTWYTWIEQGRQVSASADALARIAVALRLSRAEHAYLFELAAQRDPAEPELATADVPDTLVATVELVAAPAYVLDRQWNALAWNTPAAALFAGWLTASTIATCCASPSCRRPRALIVDWDTRARRLVAEFRADSIRHLNDAPTRSLIDALLAGSEAFAHYWASQGKRQFKYTE